MIEIEYNVEGCHRRGILRCRHEGKDVFVDKGDIHSAGFRDRCADAVMAQLPDADRAELERDLLDIASRSYDATAAACGAAPAPVDEIDSDRIVRAEAVLAAECTAVTIPITQQRGDRLESEWWIYYRARDGARRDKCAGATMGYVVGIILFLVGMTGACAPIWLRSRDRVLALLPGARALSEEFVHRWRADDYWRRGELADWSRRTAQLLSRLPVEPLWLGVYGEQRNAVRRLFRRHRERHALVKQRNRRYVERELERNAGWFDRFESFPLTLRQREAIAQDEDRMLVVAGAGTGKTSTLVGKSGYLINRNRAEPEEILLIAFAKRAQKEMADRIAERVGASIQASTFHAFGLHVLATASGAKPSLSRLAEDPGAMGQWIEQCLDRLIELPVVGPWIIEFLLYMRAPYRSEHEFDLKTDYLQYLRAQDLRTINGELVKSFEECVIANWLYANGIAYRYEADYEHHTATVQRRQYCPDFYLHEHGIYLEHFGISRDNRTAPFVDTEAYLESMHWKREQHRRHHTRLIETYSWEHREGVLLKHLERSLLTLGIPTVPRSIEEIVEQLRKQKLVSGLGQLVGRFLALFKSNQWTVDRVRDRIGRTEDPVRAAHFLDIFERVVEAYESALSDEGRIDFSDMIAQATAAIRTGRFTVPYRYVLVDEFQDISRGRARLLLAMLEARKDLRLFCVGDDWQSIFRFTGSDPSLMTRFNKTFGSHDRVSLDRTFRFNNRILDCSSRFVQRDTELIRKDLIAHGDRRETPAIMVVGVSATAPEALEEALELIAHRFEGESASVMVLGRYNFVLDELPKGRWQSDPRLRVEPMTVHKSKGLEADYVVVLEVNGDRLGFPSQMEDDPLLELLLAAPGSIDHAEERRLMYVAMTRARRETYLVTSKSRVSCFVEELAGSGYAGLVETIGMGAPDLRCPVCDGRLVLKEGRHGPFWACSNFPLCGGRCRTCSACGAWPVLPADIERSIEPVPVAAGAAGAVGPVEPGRVGGFHCAGADCGAVFERCPECGVGVVLEIDGPYGKFWGCSEYRREGASCEYKPRTG